MANAARADLSGHDGSRDGPVATPAVGAGRVFMPGPHGALVAMDASSGRELWRRDLPKDLNVKLPHYGFGASPVLVGDRLVLQVGGNEKSGLVAFEVASGALAWSTLPSETKGDSTGYTMAAPAEIGGTRQLVALGHDRVFGVRVDDGSVVWTHLPFPADGSVLWRVPLDAGLQSDERGPGSTPAVQEGLAFTLSPTCQLRGLDLASGKVVWHVDLKARFAATPRLGCASSPLLDEDRVIVQPGAAEDHRVLAFARRTGELAWSPKGDSGPTPPQAIRSADSRAR